LTQSVYDPVVNLVGAEAVAMETDPNDLRRLNPISTKVFEDAMGLQTYRRNLNESAIVQVGPNGQMTVVRGIFYYDGLIDPSQVASAMSQLKGDTNAAEVLTPGRIAVLAPFDRERGLYLFVARKVTDDFRKQIGQASGVLADYRALVDRSRTNQLRFNGALLLGALIGSDTVAATLAVFALPLILWLLTRLSLSGASVAIEQVANPLAAISRSWQLTAGNSLRLLAYYLLEVRGLRGPLVKSVTTTSMIYRLGELYDVPVHETSVGFKYLGPKMRETDALIAGEVIAPWLRR